MSAKEYRGAKNRLIKQGFLQEIFSPSWLRSKEAEKKQNIELFKKRAMKRATICCIVKLCNEEVYDINLKSKGDERGDARAMKGRQTISKEGKEYIKKTTPLPPKGGIDDVSFLNEKKEEKIHIHRGVYLSSEELQQCIEIRGSIEIVKSIIDNILDWPDRKYEIKSWVKNIKTWTLS